MGIRVSESTALLKKYVEGTTPDLVLVIVCPDQILNLQGAVDFLSKSWSVSFRRPGPGGHFKTKTPRATGKAGSSVVISRHVSVFSFLVCRQYRFSYMYWVSYREIMGKKLEKANKLS